MRLREDSSLVDSSHCQPYWLRSMTIFCNTAGMFTNPIPQGRPLRCTKISSPGVYRIQDVPGGVYHLRAAAFPVAADLHSSLLPGEKLLLGHNASPLVFHQGWLSGNPDLVLHTPRLTDPPLVMGLPLL
jgi:AraC family transcriptional regulator